MFAGMNMSVFSQFNSWSKKFYKNKDGATAVEFALISPIFFGLIFSVFELGIFMTKVTLLDLAAAEASKQVYIGAATSGTVTAADLEETICDTVSFIDSNCRGNLLLEMTPITNFRSIPTTDAQCIDKDTLLRPVVTANPGSTGETVFIRICLTTSVLVPGLGFGLNMMKTDTGKTQIVTAIAIRNEPF